MICNYDFYLHLQNMLEKITLNWDRGQQKDSSRIWCTINSTFVIIGPNNAEMIRGAQPDATFKGIIDERYKR
ncbi:MAG: hypothetical protein CO079_03170 [Nitrosopumilales archaeon CG_4_9_14_0_8_um_filter_34_10]|nr:MAG: hypothetical protein CO079_03170 [Nitrosopumilales archaeon CG_4_9_14_0_8_um_filter_34_10]